MRLGDELAACCNAATAELILAAPFVKTAVLQSILASVPDSVRITCVTRWQPDEIAAGANDLSIWPYICGRPNAALLLNPRLHAKYYRSDARCMVGSANLTATALGWHHPSNLEILLPLDASSHNLPAFEMRLMRGSVQVNDNIYSLMNSAVADLEKHLLSKVADVDPAFDAPQSPLLDPVILAVEWPLPTLRHPRDLYNVYSGNIRNITSASKAAGTFDLLQLGVPPGLTEPSFRLFVAAMLLQNPIINSLDAKFQVPQRFGAVRSFLKEQPCSVAHDFDPATIWQTLMRWLLYFYPDRYEVTTPNYSEVFGLKR